MTKKRILMFGCVLLICVIAYNVVMTSPPLDSRMINAMVTQGYDINGNSKIEKEELKNIRSLVFNGSNITSLAGLSETANPKLVSVYFTQVTGIKDYDFSKNPQVTDLRLVACKIDSIEQLKSVKNLQILSLSGNNLTKLNGIERLDGLTTLIIDHNQIADISLIKNLPKLKVLDIRDNPIVDYTLFKTTGALTTVNVSKLQYQEIIKQIPDVTTSIFEMTE